MCFESFKNNILLQTSLKCGLQLYFCVQGQTKLNLSEIRFWGLFYSILEVKPDQIKTWFFKNKLCPTISDMWNLIWLPIIGASRIRVNSFSLRNLLTKHFLNCYLYQYFLFFLAISSSSKMLKCSSETFWM